MHLYFFCKKIVQICLDWILLNNIVVFNSPLIIKFSNYEKSMF